MSHRRGPFLVFMGVGKVCRGVSLVIEPPAAPRPRSPHPLRPAPLLGQETEGVAAVVQHGPHRVGRSAPQDVDRLQPL
ncbi:hypothetical protein AB0I06_34300, partial [Streptomyces sp. NPDC050674]|uniref:hypothetical protein n=1 Tax=Streptomyces sp. NPDC050674 TaxID=3157216 RepID=UPI003434D54B